MGWLMDGLLSGTGAELGEDAGAGAVSESRETRGRRVNFFAMLVGPAGYGKTSLAAKLIEERLAAGSWVFVHDANQDYTGLCQWYRTADDWRREFAAKVAAGEPIARGAAIGGMEDASEVVDLVMELGERWNRGRGQDNKIPLCLVLDESSSIGDGGSTYMGKTQNRLLNQRRHLGIEAIYNLQQPAQLAAPFWDAATDVYLFRQTRGDRIDLMERNLSLPKGSLEFLSSLDRYRFAHWSQEKQGLI